MSFIFMIAPGFDAGTINCRHSGFTITGRIVVGGSSLGGGFLSGGSCSGTGCGSLGGITGLSMLGSGVSAGNGLFIVQASSGTWRESCLSWLTAVGGFGADFISPLTGVAEQQKTTEVLGFVVFLSCLKGPPPSPSNLDQISKIDFACLWQDCAAIESKLLLSRKKTNY